jgi:protein-tyrosine phosphatase
MTFYTTLIEGQVLFGKYPTQDEVSFLIEKEKVGCFINLVRDIENLPEYKIPDDVKMIRFPIVDKRSPTNIEAVKTLIKQIVEFRDAGKVVYIHCRGGHGRAGTIAACLMIHLGMDVDEALLKVKLCHQNRKDVSPKCRKLGCPQTASQFRFVWAFAESVTNE